MRVPTQLASAKKAPENKAITGSFAPHGINGVSIAVALRSRSLRIVRHAIIPGIAQPVPITKGITDFPESPTFLNIGSSTTVALAIYPQSSSNAIRKYMTITKGRNPTTEDTPPMIPSTSKAFTTGAASAICASAHPLNRSIHPVKTPSRSLPSPSLPSACEI